MRLLKCHIENFGKLTDLTLDLLENPMVILEQNGWGKSTLAAFIKVMFYGFANEKKRGDALERERARYKPWQGGVYGGEILFEAEGKQYVLTRTFGAKEADDTFSLTDAVTNLASEDYTQNIGEELFRINQESFQRTVYIAQNDCVTATTDSINAKVGNLADNLDDINNYEKVQKDLKDLMNSLTPHRKTGELKKLKNQIEELKDEIRNQKAVEQAIASLEERLDGCRARKEALLKEQAALQEELLRLGRQKEAEAKKEHYDRIVQNCMERQAALEDCRKAFGGRVPERQELEKALERRKRMVQQESEMRANALSEAQERELGESRDRFADNMPTEEFFARGDALLSRLEELQEEAMAGRLSAQEEQEAARLKDQFAGVNVREEDIDYYLRQWNLSSETESRLETRRAALQSRRILEESARAARKKPVSAVVFVLPVCLILLGLALWSAEPVAGMILIPAGIVMLVVLACMRLAVKSKKTAQIRSAEGSFAELEAEIARDEETVARAQREIWDFLGRVRMEDSGGGRSALDLLYTIRGDLRRYRQLQARQRDYRESGCEKRIGAAREELNALLGQYGCLQESGEKNVRTLLTELQKQTADHLHLAEKEERYRSARKAYEDGQETLRVFFAGYGQDDTQDADATLNRMLQRRTEYENDLEELAKCEEEKRAFEQNFDVSRFEGLAEDGTREMEEVRRRLQEAAEQLEAVGESRNAYLAQLEDRQQEAEQLEMSREKLSALEEQYAGGYRYYSNLELTSGYLARAKESFSARYMGPIMQAFRENYEKMSHISGEDFRIDANIRITKKEAGEQRDTRAFSAGSQDMIGICLRMALIKAMYQKEKPFLVFDDPFTNLDDEKLEYAGQFLQEIAKEYQIIYFTCRESRRAV